MSSAWRIGVAAVTLATAFLVHGQELKTDPGSPNASKKETAPAALTRTKSLKVKVTGSFTNARLGDILKEFASQVDTKTDIALMWTYGPGFPYSKELTFRVEGEPLEIALDRLLTAAGKDLGYVVISYEGDRRDGWVRLTTNGERGAARVPATAEEEEAANDRLALARKLIDSGKPSSARPVLELLIKKYANTKAGMEAKILIGKLDK